MFLIVSVLLTGCRPKPDPWVAAQRRATVAISSLLHSSNVEANGAIVMVADSKHTWRQAFGSDDRSEHNMNVDATFRIASVTKSFTAAAVLRLVDLGKLKVTDTVSRYLANPSPSQFTHWNQITVSELAHHTSGLSELTDDRRFARIHAKAGHMWTPREQLELVHTDHEPGQVYAYSNANFVILGLLVERLTGRPLFETINRSFIHPLGLKATTFPLPFQNPLPTAHGFIGDRDVTGSNPSWAWGAGNMISTVTDLGRWIRLLCSGNVVSRPSRELLFQTDPLSPTIGFGLENRGGWWGHTGRIEGYSCACFYEPKLDATIVVMVNRMDPTDPSAVPSRNISRELPILDAVFDAFFARHP